METFRVIFAALPDPRDCTAQYDLTEMLFIALAATLCGAQSCAEMAEFGVAKEPLLRRILTLEHGIPSHDTFSRVFRRLDPGGLCRGVPAFHGGVRRGGAAGAAVRRGGDRRQEPAGRLRGRAGPHAGDDGLGLGGQTRMVLGQAVAPNGNEAAGGLALLELLTLRGCVVTADALHCHRAMAEAIRNAKADYALKLKANQPGLLADAEAALATDKRVTRAETADQAHGRTERRTAIVAAAPRLAAKHRFPGLRAVARIEAWRTVGDKTSHRVYHVLLSKRFPAAEVLALVREHWSIENRLHWPLDVVFQEDLSRTRKDNAPQNLATLRHLALNILRAHPKKSSLDLKRRRAGWDDAFLLELMTHVQ